MGTMTESAQAAVIQKLLPYKEHIQKSIENKVVWFVTGNAVEIFGEYIENEDASKIEGLGIFSVHAKRDMMHRHNSLFLGSIEDIKVIGFKSQFSMLYGDNTEQYFMQVEKGIGIHAESKLEGVRQNNFFGTYVLGPILIMNPHLTKWLLQKAGVENPHLAFEEDAIQAYDIRYEEFEKRA
jgi:CobQ-like glutamine amidotransferase family enzyme